MSSPDRLYMVRSQFYIGNFEVGFVLNGERVDVYPGGKPSGGDERRGQPGEDVLRVPLDDLSRAVQPSLGSNQRQRDDDERAQGDFSFSQILRRAGQSERGHTASVSPS